MENIPIRSHDGFGIYWFDPMTASLVFEKVNDEKTIDVIKCKGWASKIHSVFRKDHVVIFYAQSGTVYLQIGNQRWDLLGDDVRLKLYRWLIINTFRVYCNDKMQFSFSYWSKTANPINLIDPGFDTMEEESSDFLVYLANNANDKTWISSLKKWENVGL